MHNHPRTGILLVLCAATLWGTTGTAQALAGASLPALWFGALRLLLASAFFALLAAAQAHGGGIWRVGLTPADMPSGGLKPADVLGAGLCMAVYNLAFFAGIRGTGVAVGTAIALGSGPVWAGLLQALWQRRPPRPAWWAGMALAVAGGLLLTAGGQAAAAPVQAGGVLLCLLSGLAYAVYSLLNKRMVAVAPAATLTGLSFGVATLLSLPVAWALAGPPVIGAAEMVAVAYTGVVTAGLAYLLFSQALRHITPATAVTLALAEPVVAFGLAATLLGEQPSAAAVAGLLLVVAGVLAVVRVELRAGPRSQPAALPL